MSRIRDLLDCTVAAADGGQPEYDAPTMTTVHAANICMWLKRDLKFDPDKEEFVNDAEANRLRSRAMRQPWMM
jgi:hypothetical protein